VKEWVVNKKTVGATLLVCSTVKQLVATTLGGAYGPDQRGVKDDK